MRLIDADKLEKELFNTPLWDNEDEDEFYELINKQPTAYDIDWVIKELEERRDYQKEFAVDNNFRIGIVNGFNKAIEIVKGGCNE